MDNVTFLENGQWKLEKAIPNKYKPEDARIGDISSGYSVLKSKVLPNGLTYKMLKSDKRSDPSRRVHALYAPGNSEPVSILETQHAQDEDNPDKVYRNSVNWTSTVPEHQGKGLMKQLYAAALMHLGEMHSDEHMSPNAHKGWVGMSKIPGVNVELSNFGPGQFGRHRMSLNNKPMDLASTFHPVVL